MKKLIILLLLLVTLSGCGDYERVEKPVGIVLSKKETKKRYYDPVVHRYKWRDNYVVTTNEGDFRVPKDGFDIVFPGDTLKIMTCIRK